MNINLISVKIKESELIKACRNNVCLSRILCSLRGIKFISLFSSLWVKIGIDNFKEGGYNWCNHYSKAHIYYTNVHIC